MARAAAAAPTMPAVVIVAVIVAAREACGVRQQQPATIATVAPIMAAVAMAVIGAVGPPKTLAENVGEPGAM